VAGRKHLEFDISNTSPHPENMFTIFQEAVGLGNRRLQIGRSSPFFTVFLPHGRDMGLQIR